MLSASATKNPVFVLSLFDTGLAVLNSLAKRHVITKGFEHDPSLFNRFALKTPTSLCPSPMDNPDALVAYLIKEASAFTAKPVLFAASDLYVEFIARHEEQLKAYFLFTMPDKLVFNQTFTKSNQTAYAKDCGANVVYQLNIDTQKSSVVIPKALHYPFLMKPIQSNLWQSCPHYRNDKVIEIPNEKALNQYLLYFKKYRIDAICQEIIPGAVNNQFEVSHYVTQSKTIVGPFIMRKIRQFATDYGTGSAGISVKNKELEALSTALVKKMDLQGFVNTEFKWDPVAKKYVFIECNLRVWQQIDLANKCGLDFAWISYLDVTGQLNKPINDYKEGITWIDPFMDAYSFLTLWGRGQLTLCEWLKSLHNVRSRGIFSLGIINRLSKWVYIIKNIPSIVKYSLKQAYQRYWGSRE